MRYKIIATDFDGTLLTKEKKVTNENKSAIEDCRKEGCKIIGVTARNISSVKGTCDVNMFDYLVSNNGACIYDVKNEKIEYLFSIKGTVASDITSYFYDISNGIDYCTAENYYSIKYKVPNKRSFHFEIGSLSEVKGQIARMNIFVNNLEEVEQFKKVIADRYFDDVYAITMVDTDKSGEKKWVSINPKGCNKAYTLGYLAKKLNIDTKDVVFFGDGQNDIEVIKSVGLGVAMGNALDEVKANADDVTLTNEESGVAKYIMKLIKQ